MYEWLIAASAVHGKAGQASRSVEGENRYMIRTTADLLTALMQKECDLLQSYSHIKHPTLIGDMYEGLTKEILNRAIFDQLDLRVVDGKIKGPTGELSGQIDCMIVAGDGEKIPFTSSWIYSSIQVIAVVEVKKNLHSKEIRDAHQNLLSVSDLGADLLQDYKTVRNCFWQLTGEDIPGDDVSALTTGRQMLFSCLARDLRIPLRIVLGYFGFKTEGNFQNGIVEYLLQNKGEKGFGPASLPSLVICEGHAVVKVNGSPFVARLTSDLPEMPGSRKEDWWPFYASIGGNSALLLLEVLWTRLRQRFPIPVEIFGEDQEVENLNFFLFAKSVPGQGWEYYFHERSEMKLKTAPAFKPWQPQILGMPEFVVFLRLSQGDQLRLDDSDLLEFLTREGRTVDELAERLKATGLIQIDASGSVLPLAETVFLGVSPKGELFVDRTDSPRSLTWALKRAEGSPEK